MYHDEVYKLYSEHFAKFCILDEINAKNHDFHSFYHGNRLVGIFHYCVCNQRVEICKNGEFEGNRRIHLFGTGPTNFEGNFDANIPVPKDYTI